jgi:hypothetical protein
MHVFPSISSAQQWVQNRCRLLLRMSLKVANPSSQDRTPRRAIVLPVSPAAAPYRASGLVLGPGTDIDPSLTFPEAVVTSGLAAIAGTDTSGGAAGSIAIWLLRVGQPKEADGVGQHGRCEQYARACSGDPSAAAHGSSAPCRSSWSFQNRPDCRPQELLYSPARRQGNCHGKLKNQD